MSDFVAIASVDELGPGDPPIVVEIEDRWVAVFNVAGTFYAIEDVCTHDSGPLAEGNIDGCVIECPRHGATFDIRTGKALSAPAYIDVKTFEVRVERGEIQIGERKRK